MQGISGNTSRPDYPQLKPSDLFDKRRQRDAARLRSYNTILEQIYTRIRTISKQGGDPWTIFTVPPFIVGLPKIDIEDCIVYLVYMLRQQSYEVRFTYPNLLYISWKHHERDYILKTSPIMTTMLAAKPQSSKPLNELRKAGTTQVRFAETVTQQQITFSPNNGRAPPRNVSDYIPPRSFLNSIEQPTAEPRKDVLKDFLNF
uniref:Uncharacterized protein n=1 Tax=viral metagenome TaxID=1070528 RepID=A0A6C0HG10_9ZZZZ